MAVTQNLARLPLAQLEKCGSSKEYLEKLINFSLLPSEDYLDLDWAPNGLEIYCEGSKQLPQVKLGLFMALHGASLVNPTYRNHIDLYSVYSDITMISPNQVQEVNTYFDRFDREAFVKWGISSEAQERKDLTQGLDCEPNEYYLRYMDKLFEFYQIAGQKKYGAIMWWD